MLLIDSILELGASQIMHTDPVSLAPHLKSIYDLALFLGFLKKEAILIIFVYCSSIVI